MSTSTVRRPTRRVTRGPISTWALTGADLSRVRTARYITADRVAVMMAVSVSRVDQLERQEHVQAATARRYLDAVEAAWREPVVTMSAEDRQAWNERRDAERERAREQYADRQDARDQERSEHRDHWYAFLREFKANAPAAFVAHCLEVADQVQPDGVGEALTALYERLAREHHVTYPLAALVRELEARAWFVRAGSVEVLVQVRDRPHRGHRPALPRMGTARRPTFDVWCCLSPFARWLVQAQSQ